MRIVSPLAVLVCLVFLLACDPIVMLPGGRLSGDAAPPPASWAFTEATETVQLETRPADPYSVNVWGIAAGEAFYVAAGNGPENEWAQHIQQDPDVRLRVEDTIYELRAVRVEDEAERSAFLEAVKRKYDYVPDPEQSTKSWLFRLEPRA